METLLKLITVLLSVVSVFGQESINMHEGLEPHVGLQALISLVICFTILASCAVSINIIHHRCGKKPN